MSRSGYGQGTRMVLRELGAVVLGPEWAPDSGLLHRYPTHS